jgi:hypothetical protein
MSDGLREQIYLNFSRQDTEALLEIWPSMLFERYCKSGMSKFPHKGSPFTGHTNHPINGFHHRCDGSPLPSVSLWH